MKHEVLPDDAVRQQLAGELRLVQEAILLVAGGAAPRAMVAGLRLGDHVLEPARRFAAEAGVRIVPSYTVDEAGLAIIVEADR